MTMVVVAAGRWWFWFWGLVMAWRLLVSMVKSPRRLVTACTSSTKVAIGEKGCQGAQLARALPGVGSKVPVCEFGEFDVKEDHVICCLLFQ